MWVLTLVAAQAYAYEVHLGWHALPGAARMLLKKVVADNQKRKAAAAPFWEERGAPGSPYTPAGLLGSRKPAASDVSQQIQEEMLAFFQAAKPPKEVPADVDMPAKMKELGLDAFYPSECWPNMAAVSCLLVCCCLSCSA